MKKRQARAAFSNSFTANL